ncbi:MAG: hypothetical protein HC812_13600 [Leptolyngbya sp. RL_3_1]|nr:hypothetical protein [Leptolyngbya sp. RL_3_1]
MRAGWLLTLLGIGGGILALTFWFRVEQLRLKAQVTSIAVHTGPDSEVVQRLTATQTQLAQLQRRVPDNLSVRLTTTEEQLSQTTEDLAILTQQQAQRRDIVSVLTNALQAVVADEAVAMDNETPDPEIGDATN